MADSFVCCFFFKIQAVYLNVNIKITFIGAGRQDPQTRLQFTGDDTQESNDPLQEEQF